ncbi:MAG: MBL fold metallo-hydrolase [Planctomycetota bacterium]
MDDPAALRIEGVSVGGVATTLDLPDLKLCVDMGRILEPAVARSVVLVTHGHADHVGGLAQHVAQRGLRRLPPATYVVPPPLVEPLERLFDVWRGMDRGAFAAELLPLSPGDEFRVRPDLVVRAFPTDHRVPSQGYLVQRRRTRLASALAGAPGPEIARLRAEGADVDEEVRSSVVAVTGDTRFRALLEQSEVLAAPTLALEATFLDDRIDAAGARERGHVHLDEVRDHAARFGCERLVLCHVSPRHALKDAQRLVRERLPADLSARTEVFPNALEGGRLPTRA